jgi:signal transduction histidine kinase
MLPSGLFDLASLGPEPPALSLPPKPYPTTTDAGLETLLSRLLNSSNDAIWVFDSAGTLQWCNQRACRRSGVELVAAIGRDAASLGVQAGPGDHWSDQLAFLQAQGSHVERGPSGLTPPRDTRVLERRAHWLPVGGGTVLVSERDATVRVRMETELRSASEQLEHLLAAAPMALVEVDTSGNVLRMSGAAARELRSEATGPAAEAPEARQVWAWIVGQPDAEAAFRRCLRGHAGTTRFCFRERGFEATLAPRYGDAGTVLGAIVVCTDVTERMASEQRAALAFDQLQRANEELQQFAYVASHDLQEPLRTVSSFLDLLEDRLGDQLTAESEEFLSFARDAVDQMRSLVGDLLRYARAVTHARPRQGVTARNAIELALADQRELVRTTQATVDIAEEMPTVFADPAQVRQVFSALLSNAIRFRSEAKPNISVRGRVEGAVARFEVTDNGMGIPQRFQERIFQIFERLQVSRRDGGSGIGLALCKRIVELHNGQIGVVSEVGNGSTFWFTLPLAPEAGEADAGLANGPASRERTTGRLAGSTGAHSRMRQG